MKKLLLSGLGLALMLCLSTSNLSAQKTMKKAAAAKTMTKEAVSKTDADACKDCPQINVTCNDCPYIMIADVKVLADPHKFDFYCNKACQAAVRKALVENKDQPIAISSPAGVALGKVRSYDDQKQVLEVEVAHEQASPTPAGTGGAGTKSSDASKAAKEKK